MRFDPQAPATGPMPTYEDRGDAGYHRSLGSLQIQMIAIGGAIGVGLFLGVGARLAAAGPALILAYLVVGVVVYLMMRALGEMVVYRPTTGAWVSYAREFVSDRLAFMTGWIHVTLAAVAGVAEIAALAVYVQFWWPELPGWIPSLVAALAIVGCNLLSVRWFGAIETTASSVKVIAILLFLAAGIVLVVAGDVFHAPTTASVSHLWANGGFAPNGLLPLLVVLGGVVFSFSAIETVGVSAGEAADPERSMPRAINSVVLRIGLFYIGSLIALSVLLPTDQYSGDESPFVTALASLHIPGIAGIMNFVVLTAAISGVNATLYSSVRVLRNLAAHGQAPRVTVRVSSRGVPAGALLSVLGVYLLGIVLIYALGASAAFEVILSACAVFILFGWISILVSHLGYRRAVAAGRAHAVHFRLPGAPVTTWVALAFLVGVALYVMFDQANPHWYYSLIAGVVILVATNVGYELSRRHVQRHGLPELTGHRR
ncbi:L-asparagine permease [Tersicoccus solisilvae]|uniref:L-asparagine permease n=1 Tax=Tersicoccus solisilvae TaxID=1882339 RepID=A0ABQ1NLS5_9MICC|nr:amino acid permease [Tersicoccus solisilvae]GGC77996.1 L-asparagine permease [Tersicoccus solisilvae]